MADVYIRLAAYLIRLVVVFLLIIVVCNKGYSQRRLMKDSEGSTVGLGGARAFGRTTGAMGYFTLSPDKNTELEFVYGKTKIEDVSTETIGFAFEKCGRIGKVNPFANVGLVVHTNTEDFAGSAIILAPGVSFDLVKDDQILFAPQIEYSFQYIIDDRVEKPIHSACVFAFHFGVYAGKSSLLLCTAGGSLGKDRGSGSIGFGIVF